MVSFSRIQYIYIYVNVFLSSLEVQAWFYWTNQELMAVLENVIMARCDSRLLSRELKAKIKKIKRWVNQCD